MHTASNPHPDRGEQWYRIRKNSISYGSLNRIRGFLNLIYESSRIQNAAEETNKSGTGIRRSEFNKFSHLDEALDVKIGLEGLHMLDKELGPDLGEEVGGRQARHNTIRLASPPISWLLIS